MQNMVERAEGPRSNDGNIETGTCAILAQKRIEDIATGELHAGTR